MRRARKRSDHGAVYSRDVKIFSYSELDEPLLTEFSARSLVSFSKVGGKTHVWRDRPIQLPLSLPDKSAQTLSEIADGWEWQKKQTYRNKDTD